MPHFVLSLHSFIDLHLPHRLAVTAAAFLLAGALSAQVAPRDREPPRSFTLSSEEGYRQVPSMDRVPVETMAPMDTEALAEAARARQDRARDPGPYMFAEPIHTAMNLENSGAWEDLEEGRLWRLRISSPGAVNLNLAFTSYELPPGAQLWVYSPDGETVRGPYTARDRSHQGRLWTPVVPGDEIVVELFVPDGVTSQPILEIGRVNHGFREFDKSGGDGPDKQGDCNKDVICPEGNPWRDQIRSVATYTIGGVGSCTGQLVNNTDEDFTPYFLSANHCGVDGTNDDTLVFFWNFESPNCGDLSGGSLADTQTGALFRASWAPSDFLLVELEELPDPSFGVVYTGWDASGATPTAAVAIHHPSGDEKAISFENHGLTTTDYLDDTPDASEHHWRVADWDDGTTEKGSSGSCLWNPANGLCVGQLHGGDAACDNDDPDWYGKLSSSWEGGGTSASRLRDWLNPANDGTVTFPGADPPTPGGPVMRLEETLLDYGEVELGFAFTRAVVVHNDGDAPLTVAVENATPMDADLVHWSEINEDPSTTIAPGDPPLVLTQVYEPDALGVHDFEIAVTGDDPGNPAVTVVLQGEGVSPTPIDTALVLDRSGSMDETAGERRKIDAMADAADLYAHLLRPGAGAGTGDRFGFVRYNATSQVYLDLDFPDAPGAGGSHLAEAEDSLSDAAVVDAARLRPDGATGIGGAMETAAGILPPPAGDRKHVMIVLTDGIENRTPYISTVLGPIQTADPDLEIYSIGLGMNIQPTKLQEITNISNGYHQVADDLSGTTLFDLETFYFKIFANATGMELVVDPTYAVPLVGTEPVVIERARVVSSDRTATFVVFERPDLRPLYDLELVDPDGDVIVPGSTVGGVPVHVMQRETYTIFRVVFPNPSQASEYVGDWILRMRPRLADVPKLQQQVSALATTAQRASIDPQRGYAPIGFAAAVGSNYRMEPGVHPSHYLPGAEVTLTAGLTDRGWPSLDGSVRVDATTPGGTSVPGIELRDDGSGGDVEAGDGVYTGRFLQTAQSGSYRFLFRAVGRNHRGELTPREDTRYLTLKHPEFPGRPGDGDGGDGDGGQDGGGFLGGRRLGYSFHVGSAHPVGDLDDPLDSNVHFRLDAGYPLTDRLKLVAMAGYSQLTAETATGANHPRWINLSLNAQALFPTATGLRWYVQGGPGAYWPESGSSEVGFNVGFGVQIPLASGPFALELGADYHSVQVDEEQEFVTVQLGVLFR